MARSTVELIVDASKAVSPLKRVTVETKKLEAATRDMNGRLRDSKGRFVAAGNGAKTASNGIGKLSGAFSKLSGALAAVGATAAAVSALKFSITKTAELETQTRSLKVLTGSLDTAKGIIKELQDFGAVTPFTSTELIDTAKRLKAFGIDTEKLVETTKRLGDVAGATGADLDGIATAYGQIQAKGKLQTEELLQLQERGVDLAGVLKKEYGLTGEEFSKALQKGQISAQAAEFALQKLTSAGGKYADGAIAQSDTLAGKFSTLQDNVTRFAQRIGQVLSPVLKGLLDQVNELISGFNRLFLQGDLEAKLFAAGELDPKSRKALFDESFKEAERLAKLGKFGQGEIGTKALEIYQEALKGVARDVGLIQEKVRSLGKVELPEFLSPTASGGGAAAAAEKDFSVSGLDPTLKAEESFARQVIQIARGNELLRARLEGTEKEASQQQKIESIIESAGFTEADRIKAARATLEVLFNQTTELKNQETAQKNLADAQAAAAAKLDQIYRSIGDSITTGIVDSLTAAVEGTKTLAEVAADTLRNVSNILIQFGVQSFLGGLGGNDNRGFFTKLFGGGRANGGSVRAGTSYLVGERGPELFTPGRSGSIAPNSAIKGSSIVVNVDASGSQVQGDGNNANQLGKAIGAAVQAELIKQQRPGGLLAR